MAVGSGWFRLRKASMTPPPTCLRLYNESSRARVETFHVLVIAPARKSKRVRDGIGSSFYWFMVTVVHLLRQTAAGFP